MNKLRFLRMYFKALFLFTFVVTAASNLSAQQRIDKIVVQTFTATFQTIVGQPGTIGLGMQGCISCDAAVSLPFNFIFDAQTYSAGTTFYINSVGAIHFGPENSSYYSRIVPYFGGNASSFPNSICPMTGLQYPIGSGGVYYQVSGVSPNRVLTVEWNQMQDYWNGGYITSYQAKLYETTSQIDFWYQNWNYPLGGEVSSYYHNVGLNGSASGFLQTIIIGGTSNFNTPSSNYRLSYPPPVQLSVTPKTLVYGPVVGGSSVTLCVTVKHTGTGGQLTFNSTSIVGSSDFTVVSAPAGPIDVGQTGQFCVKFNPTGSGARSATFTLVSNGRDSGTQSVALNGTGLYPQIAVDSLIRFKKTRTRMGDSLTQWVHISSTGQAPLLLSSFPLTGIDADQYFISHFPANPIPQGTVDSLGITYTPTREGKHVATITINNNSVNLPSIPISLQGSGSLPHIVVTPSILRFDSAREGQTVCKTINIYNPGSDTLRILANILSSNDGDFHYTGLTTYTDMNIAPEQTRSVSICVTPVQQGTRQARLLLKTNIIKTYDTPRLDTAGTIFVDATATGTPFGVLAPSLSGSSDADSSLVGVKICRNAILRNDGDADILVQTITVGGSNPTNFNYSGLPTLPFLLKARTSLTFSVCGTPDKQGALSADMVVSGTTSGSPISSDLPLSVFGIKPCVGATPDKLFETTVLPNNGSDSTLCVTINNCGDMDAIYHVAISGAKAGDYTVTPSVSGTVTAKTGTTQFCVKYKPTVVGASAASLDVTAEDGSASISVPLSGTDGCAIVTATPDAVPSTGVLASSTFNVTINNTGTFDWTANSGVVTPADNVFSIVGLDQPTAPAGSGAIIVHMKFAPTVLGNASAILTFPGAGPCENTPISVTLNGVGAVNSVTDAMADGFSLDQSYPNPTKDNATFTYSTPRETEVRISLADLTGKLVRTLVTGRVSEGIHTVNFEATGLASGTYIYMLESGSTRLVKQLILTR